MLCIPKLPWKGTKNLYCKSREGGEARFVFGRGELYFFTHNAWRKRKSLVFSKLEKEEPCSHYFYIRGIERNETKGSSSWLGISMVKDTIYARRKRFIIFYWLQLKIRSLKQGNYNYGPYLGIIELSEKHKR